MNTNTLPTVTRTQLPSGCHRYKVNGEVHTAKSRKFYTHASVYRVNEKAQYDYNEVGALVVFLHSRADLAAKGNADGNFIAKSGNWSRIPGVVEITE